MNYLFLDIDGVLNTWINDSLDGAWIQPSKVERLNKILERVDRVVLSSDWRRFVHEDWMTLKGMSFLLSSHGLRKRETGVHSFAELLHGVTAEKKPRLSLYQTRDREILDYVKSNLAQEDNWIVLDDLLLDLGNHQFRFVQTDSTVGLQDRHVDRALKVLDGV